MLITMKAILELAEVKNIAIGAFNITSLEGIQAVLEASEELNQPVILQFAPVHEAIIPMKVIGPIMLMMAERASVPVAVHLDHGDDLSILKKALDMGFTSVMYDGSALSFEENAANTRIAVEMAGTYGASVEAEIGAMGRQEFSSIGRRGRSHGRLLYGPGAGGEICKNHGDRCTGMLLWNGSRTLHYGTKAGF